MLSSKSNSLLALSLATLIATSLVGCGVRNQAQNRNKLQMIDGSETVVPFDGAGSKNLQVPGDKFGPMDPSNQKVDEPAAAPVAAPVAPAASQPAKATVAPAVAPATAASAPAEVKTCSAKACAFDSITIDAAPEDHLKVKSTTSNEKIIVSLNSVVKIKKSQPALEGTALSFITAKEVKVLNFDLGECRLLAKNISTVDAQSIRVALMGMDDKNSMNSNGCLVKLSELSMTGFSLELQQVSVSGLFNEAVLPVVRLNVAPHSMDQAVDTSR